MTLHRHPVLVLPWTGVCFLLGLGSALAQQEKAPLCIDGFCIGQTIHSPRFEAVSWLVPKETVKQRCEGIACQPSVAFRGYSPEVQQELAEVVSLKYGLTGYTPITNKNLELLRVYKYECNQTARGIFGERRFAGLYRSVPSGYLTVVGLRLINGNLTVYRVARQYPYRTREELVGLAKQIKEQYGNSVLLVDYLSSNAPPAVIEQGKLGWFARSTMFTPTDAARNAAELVLIDAATRNYLEPTDMPESGDIKPFSVKLAPQCSRSLPLN